MVDKETKPTVVFTARKVFGTYYECSMECETCKLSKSLVSEQSIDISAKKLKTGLSEQGCNHEF